MTGNQLGGLIRAIMAVLSGFAISYGIDEETWVSITGALVTLFTAAWSLYSNTLSEQTKAVAASHQVKEILAEPELANAVSNPKVRDDPTADII